jgi:hypothetical protein
MKRAETADIAYPSTYRVISFPRTKVRSFFMLEAAFIWGK